MLPDETPPDAPVVAVTVDQPEPTPANADESSIAEAREEIARISGAIGQIENRITEGLEGERAWTTETITSLRQEVADLRANLQQVGESLPSQMATLREELTRLSQELQAIQMARVVQSEDELTAPELTPPVSPPDENAGDGTSSIANAPDASQSAPGNQPHRRGKRVI